MPASYGLQMSYTNKNLYMSCSVVSPFLDSHIERALSSDVYCRETKYRSGMMQNYCNFVVSYTFDFGKDIKKENDGLENEARSALIEIN